MKRLSVFIPILLTIVLALSIVSNANASPDIIYSDLSDGDLTNTGVVSTVAGNFRAGDDNLNRYMRAFIKFDISGVSGYVTSATLYLTMDYSYRDGTQYTGASLVNPGLGRCEVRHIADYGSIGVEDFNAPSIGNDPGELISSTATPDALSLVSVDITDAIRDDIAKGRAWSTFLIKMETDISLDSAHDRWGFYSADSVTYSPYIEYELGARPVGGIYAPNDKLNILAPYIALVSLIGAISTIFVIRRWRKD